MQEYLRFMSIGICSILTIFSILTTFNSTRKKFSLFSMSLIGTGLLLADKLARFFNGSPDIINGYITKISKFFVYCFFLLIISAFNQYLKDLFISEGKLTTIPKRLFHTDLICFAGIVTLITSQFTGLYYTFENNVYHRSEGYIISYFFPLCALIFQLTAIIQYRKNLKRIQLVMLLLFTIMPIIAGSLQFIIHGVSLTSLCIVAMIVLLYCFSIFDTNRSLMEKQEKIQLMVSQTTLALVEAIDAKDKYTKGHSKRVANYSVMIAKKAGLSEEECEEIYLVALLHDVGKIGIPDTLINKEGKLTDEEMEIMRSHPKVGRDILSQINIAPNLCVGASFHHERFDGKGYPFGLRGEEIPLMARIIAVADSYDAMASTRSYRDVLPQNVIREELEKGCGTQFDSEFAKIMIKLIDEDPNYNLKQGKRKNSKA